MRSPAETGRYDIVFTRPNRINLCACSAIVEALASGRQPDKEALVATGYLMRTTAVYGNGKFGIADQLVKYDGEGAFQAEMLTVFLIYRAIFGRILCNPKAET